MPEPIVCKVTNFGERSQATQTSTIFNTTTQNIQWTTTRAGKSRANSALIGQVLSQRRSIPWAFLWVQETVITNSAPGALWNEKTTETGHGYFIVWSGWHYFTWNGRPRKSHCLHIQNIDSHWEKLISTGKGSTWYFGVKFHQYLYGHKFTLKVYLKPKILDPKTVAACLQRWVLILSAYQYDIVYRKSADYANADFLRPWILGILVAEEAEIFYFRKVNCPFLHKGYVKQQRSTLQFIECGTTIATLF